MIGLLFLASPTGFAPQILLMRGMTWFKSELLSQARRNASRYGLVTLGF